MVYSNLLFEENNSGSDRDSLVKTQSTTPSGTLVYYNGTSISKFAGPVPFVELSTSIQNNSSDIPSIQTTSISLNGKIVRYSNAIDNAGLTPGGSGIVSLMGAASGIKDLFESCQFGKFEIKCDDNAIYTASGVTLKDINFSQTPDNWTSTIDYTVSLEHISPLSGSADWVTDKTDRWSVETLDNTHSTNLSHNISHQKEEYSNPKLGASPGSTIPPTNIGGGNTFSTDIDIISIPQFRITHTVSARGMPKPSGDSTCADTSSMRRDSLDRARDWVMSQVKRSTAANASAVSGFMPYFNWPPTPAAGSTVPSTFLYNHVRSINIDYSNYELTDTWMAMPTGLPYTEDFTIETSTSEDFTKTVRVVGNIIGLQPYEDGMGIDLKANSGISLGDSLNVPNSVLSTYTELDDGNRTSSNNQINGNKYKNAYDGWINDIKPHLYRRACIGMNSADRTLTYVDPSRLTDPPNNPIYSKERPLSTICNSLTESHDPRKGTIGYTAEYNNRLKIISGVLSENIDISYGVPRDEVATISVPGRALGPILSRTGRSAATKTINISVVVAPPSSVNGTLLNHQDCPMFTGARVYKTIEDLIDGNKPFVSSKLISSINTNGIVYTQSDNESWSASQGRYSRNVTWIYQNCDISKGYMDH